MNLFAQIIPDIFRHLEKYFYYLGIELPSRPFVDFNLSCLQGFFGG